jgi:Cytochrome bd terminal oxidase subunit I
VNPLLTLASTLAPAQQEHLLEARQMQALSFAVHIPLVCFGIALPPLLLYVECRYLRTGDELYRALARRWTRIMVALFVAGVVTGTILSFEMGLLWPNFTGTFGGVFRLGFAIEGFSFFMEAIFIGIYVYGWDRLSPRAHFASRLVKPGSYDPHAWLRNGSLESARGLVRGQADVAPTMEWLAEGLLVSVLKAQLPRRGAPRRADRVHP